MTPNHDLDLSLRVERLEQANRRLTLVVCALLGSALFAVAGWQDAAQAPVIPDLLQVHKLQVVDLKGVPMVSFETGRSNEGGSITLRDKNGERRAWWTSSPEGSNLGLTKEKDPTMEGSNTAGLSVSQSSSEMNLIGPKNGMVNLSVRDDQPRVDLWNEKGKSVFSAPFRK